MKAESSIYRVLQISNSNPHSLFLLAQLTLPRRPYSPHQWEWTNWLRGYVEIICELGWGLKINLVKQFSNSWLDLWVKICRHIKIKLHWHYVWRFKITWNQNAWENSWCMGNFFLMSLVHLFPSYFLGLGMGEKYLVTRSLFSDNWFRTTNLRIIVKTSWGLQLFKKIFLHKQNIIIKYLEYYSSL